MSASRLLEPTLTLRLTDADHVTVELRPRHNAESPALLELVLEDAAVRELYHRMIGLRHLEREAKLNRRGPA